jgi:hypothetical protein
MLLLVVGFLTPVTSGSASPEVPVMTLHQADGSAFQAHPWIHDGREGWETISGYTILRDPESFEWRYARITAQGVLEPTSRHVDAADTLVPQVAKHLRPGQRPAVPKSVAAQPQPEVAKPGPGQRPAVLKPVAAPSQPEVAKTKHLRSGQRPVSSKPTTEHTHPERRPIHQQIAPSPRRSFSHTVTQTRNPTSSAHFPATVPPPISAAPRLAAPQAIITIRSTLPERPAADQPCACQPMQTNTPRGVIYHPTGEPRVVEGQPMIEFVSGSRPIQFIDP